MIEPTAIFILFIIALFIASFAILVTVLLQSLIRSRLVKAKPIQLVFVILVALFLLPTFGMVGFSLDKIATTLFLANLMLLFFLRNKFISFAIIAGNTITLILFLLIFKGMNSTLSISHIIYELSLVENSYFYICFYIIIILSILIAIVLAYKKNLKQPKFIIGIYVILILILSGCVYFDFQKYHNKLAGRVDKHISITDAMDYVPLIRDKSIWVVGSDGSGLKKVVEVKKTILSYELSNDEKFLSYMVNDDKTRGYSNNILEAKIINIENSEEKTITLPRNSKLVDWHWSQDNRMLLSIYIDEPKNGESEDLNKNDSGNNNKYFTYILDTNGSISKTFNFYTRERGWLGNDIFLVRNYLVSSSTISNKFDLFVSKNGTDEPVFIATCPISMSFGSVEVFSANDGKRVIFNASLENKLYAVNVETKQTDKIIIKNISNRNTMEFSPDFKYFTDSINGSENIFILSTTDTDYKLIVRGERISPKWLNSSQKIVYESKKGLMTTDLNGETAQITSNENDELFFDI